MEPGRRHGVTLAVEAGGFHFPRVEDVDGEVVGQVTDDAERDTGAASVWTRTSGTGSRAEAISPHRWGRTSSFCDLPRGRE